MQFRPYVASLFAVCILVGCDFTEALETQVEAPFVQTEVQIDTVIVATTCQGGRATPVVIGTGRLPQVAEAEDIRDTWLRLQVIRNRRAFGPPVSPSSAVSPGDTVDVALEVRHLSSNSVRPGGGVPVVSRRLLASGELPRGTYTAQYLRGGLLRHAPFDVACPPPGGDDE